jgi:hypothetical protein
MILPTSMITIAENGFVTHYCVECADENPDIHAREDYPHLHYLGNHFSPPPFSRIVAGTTAGCHQEKSGRCLNCRCVMNCPSRWR